ncbi:hypothetical protein [Streptomyces sp. MAR4 CNX-425]|uniref:hypothetical protein n=1 Tax=Streptomyces sp. MAR4 CNX-425 TaxID=3406343 RepID=UPI003B506AC4
MSIPSHHPRRTFRFLLLALTPALVTGVLGCGAQEDNQSSAAPQKPSLASGKPLDAAMRESADQGLGFSLHDVDNPGDAIHPAHARRYKVCYVRDAPKFSAVDIYAVRENKECPTRTAAQ